MGDKPPKMMVNTTLNDFIQSKTLLKSLPAKFTFQFTDLSLGLS